jgi:uncharacterized protein YjlB
MIIIIPIITAILFDGNPEKNQKYTTRNAEIMHMVLKDDGIFPNNSLPLIIYKDVIDFSNGGNASLIEKIFQENSWGNSWRNGIYGFHHYHSTAHEVLGVYSGSAKVQLGGEQGEIFKIEKGDVVLIPAGVSHKNLESTGDFRVVGAYPKGQSWDMNYGKENERPAADQNIKNVPLPDLDPVYGKSGPVIELWKHGMKD